jgi:hypothetical protein
MFIRMPELQPDKLVDDTEYDIYDSYTGKIYRRKKFNGKISTSVKLIFYRNVDKHGPGYNIVNPSRYKIYAINAPDIPGGSPVPITGGSRSVKKQRNWRKNKRTHKNRRRHS